MKPIKFHAKEILRLLEANKTLRTDELLKIIGCAPRTLYIKLGEYEYMSSINQKRKFITQQHRNMTKTVYGSTEEQYSQNGAELKKQLCSW